MRPWPNRAGWIGWAAIGREARESTVSGLARAFWSKFPLREVLLVVAVLAVFYFRYQLEFGEREATHDHLLHVQGRLVDPRSGQPVVDAWVLALPSDLVHEWPAEIARLREKHAKDEFWPPIGIGGGWPRWGEATTDMDGRFSMQIGVPWPYRWRKGDERRPREYLPPDRHGVAALHILSHDAAPTRIPVAGGEWTLADPAGGPHNWATWDLGDLPAASGP